MALESAVPLTLGELNERQAELNMVKEAGALLLLHAPRPIRYKKQFSAVPVATRGRQAARR